MERKLIGLGYWNANGMATAIVAIANYYDGELFDWAAYIGATTKTEHQEDAHREVAKYGCKLDSGFAFYLAERRGHNLVRSKYRD